MPMHWKWAVWLTSFPVAVLVALWTRSFGGAVTVWVLLVFGIPMVWADFVLRRKHRQQSWGERREHRKGASRG
jgi:hypothetical protein